jgi:hypothetical protein
MTRAEKDAVILLDVIARAQTLIELASDEALTIVQNCVQFGEYSTNQAERLIVSDFITHVRDASIKGE